MTKEIAKDIQLFGITNQRFIKDFAISVVNAMERRGFSINRIASSLEDMIDQGDGTTRLRAIALYAYFLSLAQEVVEPVDTTLTSKADIETF